MCPVSLLNYAKKKKQRSAPRDWLAWRAAPPRSAWHSGGIRADGAVLARAAAVGSPFFVRLSGEFVREFTWVTLMEAKPQGESASLPLPAPVFSCCFPAPCKTQPPSPSPPWPTGERGRLWRQLWSVRRHVSFLARKVSLFLNHNVAFQTLWGFLALYSGGFYFSAGPRG